MRQRTLIGLRNSATRVFTVPLGMSWFDHYSPSYRQGLLWELVADAMELTDRYTQNASLTS
jgi:hypothetical protein